MKHILCLVMLVVLIGCSAANKPTVRSQGEQWYCLQACMLRPHNVNADRGDLMGECELECR